MRFDADIIKGLFKDVVNSITEHVHKLLQQDENKDIKAVVLVGGFSESPILHQAFKNEFPGLNVVVPIQAVSAVLTGAVIFGHNPSAISHRIIKLTYGLQIRLPFDGSKHPTSSRKKGSDGLKWCPDIFDKHVEAGQAVRLGESSHNANYYPANSESTSMRINVFASTEKSPQLVTDSHCTLVGSLKIPLSGSGDNRAVAIGMVFGGTEIEVHCTELSTKNVSVITIDFLT